MARARRIVSVTLVVAAAVALAVAAAVYLAGSGYLGPLPSRGEIRGTRLPEGELRLRESRVRAAAPAEGGGKQILFGDLHVHTTFSYDAFLQNLPVTGGSGAHPPADACDFARYCAGLDFWSINDHAENLSAPLWRETVASIRQCNALAGATAEPDSVAFLGWEWTQAGTTPDGHYGHKNVVLRDLDAEAVPVRPIAAARAFAAIPRLGAMELGALALLKRDPLYLELARHIREAASMQLCGERPVDADDCQAVAATPRDLFAGLRAGGAEALVIPHGTSWGIYTPPGSDWRKQLATTDPEIERLIEVFSGHGNSEEFRDFRAVTFDEEGNAVCPAPEPDYEPACHRAGEIIRERCLAAGFGEDECGRRAGVARAFHARGGVAGHLAVGDARASDWGDSGQCRDCYLPAFNYRPGSSAQAILAVRDAAGLPAERRFRLGFIASSDNHSARPGTGYKEFGIGAMTDGRRAGVNPYAGPARADGDLALQASPVDADVVREAGVRAYETERVTSFLYTGGLVAVHAEGRGRDAIWNALKRREVYGTSGPRILLWFDLIDDQGRPTIPMGGEVTLSSPPRFRVRAAGSFAQNGGCPDAARAALGADRLQALCLGECYYPSDTRRLISRIEVVRIRPQVEPEESLAALIEDPWKSIPCAPDPAGCEAVFEDPEFVSDARDSVYYVRAVEEPGSAVNADPRGCAGESPDSGCLAPTEERAWSSPIYVDHVDASAFSG